MTPCPVCSKPATRTWCSQACHATTRRNRRTWQCKACGRDFERLAGEGRGVYCSRPCRYSHKAAAATHYLRKGYKYVHRIVAETMLGRSFTDSEVVHHKDGNRLNNAPENLEVHESHSAHMKEHAARGEIGFTHEQAVRAGTLSGAVRRAKARKK